MECYLVTYKSCHVTLLPEMFTQCYLVTWNKHPMLPCYLKPMDGVHYYQPPNRFLKLCYKYDVHLVHRLWHKAYILLFAMCVWSLFYWVENLNQAWNVIAIKCLFSQYVHNPCELLRLCQIHEAPQLDLTNRHDIRTCAVTGHKT